MIVWHGSVAPPCKTERLKFGEVWATGFCRLQLKADVEPIADVEKIQTKTKTETKTETKRVKTPTRGRFAPLAQVPPTSFPFSFPFSFEFSQHPQLAQHPP